MAAATTDACKATCRQFEELNPSKIKSAPTVELIKSSREGLYQHDTTASMELIWHALCRDVCVPCPGNLIMSGSLNRLNKKCSTSSSVSGPPKFNSSTPTLSAVPGGC